MNYLNCLIQELCPNGVTYQKLESFLKIKNGGDYKHLGRGTYPVYGSGGIMTYVDSFVFDKPSVLIPRKGSIDKLYYATEPFWNVDTVFYTDIDVTVAVPQYVYFCLQKSHLEQHNTAGGVPSLTQKVLNNIRIPIPPLPVQREIVRILDNFTELTAELTAELAARRKQYEHYRDELLQNPTNSTMMTLGAIADYRRGSFPQPYGNSEWYGGVGAMPFVQVADVEENGMVLREQTKQQISVVAQSKSVYVPAGTVICSIQGSIGRVAITQYDAYVDRTLAIFEKYKTDINKRYFAYQIQRKFGIEKEFARGSTLKTITKEEFTKFEIPVPPITEQERIVSVLDRFDTLCNDLTSGLPAEIAARQKQYEYYRDRLLTFKEWDA